MLITGDCAIFSRKGSEINAIVKLVSYLQGFTYRCKNMSNITNNNYNNNMNSNNNNNNISNSYIISAN